MRTHSSLITHSILPLLTSITQSLQALAYHPSIQWQHMEASWVPTFHDVQLELSIAPGRKPSPLDPPGRCADIWNSRALATILDFEPPAARGTFTFYPLTFDRDDQIARRFQHLAYMVHEAKQRAARAWHPVSPLSARQLQWVISGLYRPHLQAVTHHDALDKGTARR